MESNDNPRGTMNGAVFGPGHFIPPRLTSSQRGTQEYVDYYEWVSIWFTFDEYADVLVVLNRETVALA
jgi:hypothetical protein